VHLGEHVTLLFEDELTIRYQIQEMLRIERVFEEEGIRDELDAYNPLVPDGSNLKATMLIEYEDVDERKSALARLNGIERCVFLDVEARPRRRDRRRGSAAIDRREDRRGALPALRARPRVRVGAEARSAARDRRRPPAYQASDIPRSPRRRASRTARLRAHRESLSRPSRGIGGLRRRARSTLSRGSCRTGTGKSVIDFLTRAMAPCRSSRLAPETRTGVALDRRLHLDLAVLDQLDDPLRKLLLDPDADRDALLHLVAGDLLDVTVLERSECRRRAS
jgi:hypothetical protein